MKAAACWHENGIWCEGKPSEYFRDYARVISLVGGGGKTSLMDHLARAFQAQGHRTVAMTTTRIVRPERMCDTLEACRANWAQGIYAVCGQNAEDDKIMEPEASLLEALLVQAERILIEADGAKKRPCKVPAAHEPVLLPECDAVIGIMGLDALGQPVGEICHRKELVCALLGCSPEHRLTETDMVRILLSPDGTRKHVGQRKYSIVLNKCDDAARMEQGKKIIALLEAQGHTETVLTRLL